MVCIWPWITWAGCIVIMVVTLGQLPFSVAQEDFREAAVPTYHSNDAQTTVRVMSSFVQHHFRGHVISSDIDALTSSNGHVTSSEGHVISVDGNSILSSSHVMSSEGHVTITQLPPTQTIQTTSDKKAGSISLSALSSGNNTSHHTDTLPVITGVPSMTIPLGNRTINPVESTSFIGSGTPLATTTAVHHSTTSNQFSSARPVPSSVTSGASSVVDVTTVAPPTAPPTMRPGLYILMTVLPPAIFGTLLLLLCPILCCVCHRCRGGVNERTRRYRGHKYERVEVI